VLEPRGLESRVAGFHAEMGDVNFMVVEAQVRKLKRDADVAPRLTGNMDSVARKP